jgi:hypothetical protein
MNTDKNIDRLFRERLENLEATPNKKVWKEIESKITKKKRKVFPFWWFSSGIAALLIIGFSLFPFDNSIDQFKQNPAEEIITKTPDATIESFVKESFETKIVQKREKEVTPINQKKIIKNKPNNRLAIKVNSASKEIKETSNNDVSAIKKEFFKKEKNPAVIEDVLEKTKENTVIITKNTENSKNDKVSNKIDIKKLIEDTKEEKKIENFVKKSWSIAPVFAILNSNSFTNTSPIHSGLSGSTKGKSSISYGVQIAYQINEKWSIQSGLHMQEMRFKNNHITIISSSTNASSITFNSDETFAFESNSEAFFDVSSSPLNAISLNGELAQNYSYYEIPLEIKYHLIGQNKFRTHLIGGFSTLFLKENQIRLSTPSLSEEGKATNLNSINFSGNLGLDLNYTLNTNWSMHINPMFKAQLNTFSENSNDFSPFNIGVYTGVKYSF